eukprot:COSAG02_NODE_11290_length_1754_cov_1.406042_1_plen_264_part_10
MNAETRRSILREWCRPRSKPDLVRLPEVASDFLRTQHRTTWSEDGRIVTLTFVDGINDAVPLFIDAHSPGTICSAIKEKAEELLKAQCSASSSTEAGMYSAADADGTEVHLRVSSNGLHLTYHESDRARTYEHLEIRTWFTEADALTVVLLDGQEVTFVTTSCQMIAAEMKQFSVELAIKQSVQNDNYDVVFDGNVGHLHVHGSALQFYGDNTNHSIRYRHIRSWHEVSDGFVILLANGDEVECTTADANKICCAIKEKSEEAW